MPTRRDKETTRQILLETGFEMMLERGLEVGWGVRLADVTARVGLTTGAAYQIWSGSRTQHGAGGQDRFHHDLALYAMHRLIADYPLGHREQAQALIDGGATLDGVLQQAMANSFSEVSAAPEMSLFLALISVAPSDPEIAAAGRDTYQLVTEQYVELYTKVFDLFDIEMRRPYRLEDLVTAVIALADGMSMRLLVDPDAVARDLPAPVDAPPDSVDPWHLFSVGAIALFRHMTQPRRSDEPATT